MIIYEFDEAQGYTEPVARMSPLYWDTYTTDGHTGGSIFSSVDGAGIMREDLLGKVVLAWEGYAVGSRRFFLDEKEFP